MNAVATNRTAGSAGSAPAAAPRINRRKYANLLTEALPAAISSKAELERLTKIVDRLAVKERLSPEEDRLLNLLSTLIEVYEDENFPVPDAPPHVMIQGFMQERGLRNKDLQPALGSSGVTSEIISGKRKPSKAQIRSLAAFFKVPPKFFVASVVE